MNANANRTAGDRRGSAVVTLTSDTEITITRSFAAPAELVFRAFTTPDLVKRWWSKEDGTWDVCEIDLRPGGRWRWVFRIGDLPVGFHGEYREVDRPHRLVYTEMYEMPGAPAPGPGDDVVVTLTLDEEDGSTAMTMLARHPSQEVRDLVLASGMEEGMQAAFDRLEDVARSTGAPAD